MAGAVTPAIARESYLHISTAVSAEMPENFFDRHPLSGRFWPDMEIFDTIAVPIIVKVQSCVFAAL
jgi:hypothetical protein